MQKHRLPPVAIALAIVMLTGCKDPVGLPNEARTASVHYGIVPYQDSATGHIDYFEDPPRGVPMYSRDVPGIKWGDTKNQDGEEYPRTNGFSVFHIPYIPNSEAEIWPCSLYYYLRQQSGDTNFRLVVTELSSDPRWGAPDHMDTRIVECSMKPEVMFGYREEAAEVLLA